MALNMPWLSFPSAWSSQPVQYYFLLHPYRQTSHKTRHLSSKPKPKQVLFLKTKQASRLPPKPAPMPYFGAVSSATSDEVVSSKTILRLVSHQPDQFGEMHEEVSWYKRRHQRKPCSKCKDLRRRSECPLGSDCPWSDDVATWRAPRPAERSFRSVTALPPPGFTPLSPPDNFGAVLPGQVYRSAYPTPASYDFLSSHLGVRTILTLVPEPLPEAYQDFVLLNGIRHVQLPVAPNKPGRDGVDAATMTAALQVLADPANWPLLVHCNKGKHRTGCVVACYRKLLAAGDCTDALDEYAVYAGEKQRDGDRDFILRYNVADLLQPAIAEELPRDRQETALVSGVMA